MGKKIVIIKKPAPKPQPAPMPMHQYKTGKKNV
jgi:hypothetical protein